MVIVGVVLVVNFSASFSHGAGPGNLEVWATSNVGSIPGAPPRYLSIHIDNAFHVVELDSLLNDTKNIVEFQLSPFGPLVQGNQSTGQLSKFKVRRLVSMMYAQDFFHLKGPPSHLYDAHYCHLKVSCGTQENSIDMPLGLEDYEGTRFFWKDYEIEDAYPRFRSIWNTIILDGPQNSVVSQVFLFPPPIADRGKQ